MLFLTHLKQWLQSLIDDLFYYDIWNVGIVHGPVNEIVNGIETLTELKNIEWLPPQPPLQYIADPFIYRYQAHTYLLVESYRHRPHGKGRIYKANLTASLGHLVFEEALVAAHHLSYPYTLTLDDQVYCIPEMAQSNQCQLYKLHENGAFVFEKVLSEGVGMVDPTLFFHHAWWWLFFADRKQNRTTLLAYYAKSLWGEWQPHGLNPLKCDRTSARPAGKPFVCNGKLYRPAQDCSQTYGGAITINEVIELSPSTFHEVVVCTLHPDPTGPYPDGLHHLVVEEDLILIDGKKRVFDLAFKFKQWW